MTKLLIIAALAAPASADPNRTPYDAGHVTIHLGFYRLGDDLDGLRLGAGYTVIRGLELGGAVAHLWGQPATVDVIEPFALYNLAQWYEQLPLVPYVGLSYLHRWTDPMFYVSDAIGTRAGLQYTLEQHETLPVIIGGGVYWNHPTGDGKEEVGPEVFAIVGF
ncbi:MAG: hypothetical protein QM831_25105 [Kofleriaceae bacterium]